MIYSLSDRVPQLVADTWVAPSAQVMGSVVMEPRSSVWFGAVIRGDNDVITLGEGTNVQDNAVVHTDPGLRCTLGKGVTVGHHAMVHGCTVGDYSLVGIHSILLNRCVIGRFCIIGANALVTEGKVIPDYSVVMGSPGKIVKQLTADDEPMLKMLAANYVLNAQRFREQLREIVG